MNSGTGIYKSGVLAFFAGAILIGALLGAVTFCFMGSDELSMLSVFSNSFVDVRSSGDLEEILVRSFFSSTVFFSSCVFVRFFFTGTAFSCCSIAVAWHGLGCCNVSALQHLRWTWCITFSDVCTSSCSHNSGGTYDSRKGSCRYVKYPAAHCFF